MKTIVLFITIIFILPELIQAQITEKSEYICSPCGCESDHKIFDGPGSCPSCSMTLLNKNDLNAGLKYENIYPADVCERLSQNPDVLLLDVRSKDEFDGITSNLGRLKNSKHIHIADIEERVNEIELYKNKEIIVYCSISMRSPRVSKYLADNGFTNVKNMMGGMTLWNQLTIDELGCKNKLLVK